jgi:uncharacterized membrane protein HdeD (DUF308 family)
VIEILWQTDPERVISHRVGAAPLRGVSSRTLQTIGRVQEMATTSEHSSGRGLGAGAELRERWGWFVALGILMLIVGFIALFHLFVATLVSVYWIGILMLVGGVFQIVHAFSVKTWGGMVWWLLSGLVYAAAGIVAFVNPLLASSVLTLLLAAALLAAGVMRVWVGFQDRAQPNSGWIIAAGVVTALAGIVIALGWPVNSLFILGMFLAIDLIFQGAALTAFGMALKR